MAAVQPMHPARCPACGHRTSNGARFCGRCGAKVAVDPAAGRRQVDERATKG